MSKRGSGRSARPLDRPAATPARGRVSSAAPGSTPGRRSRLRWRPAGWLALGVATVAILLVGIFGSGLLGGPGTASRATASPDGPTVESTGGHWTNITPDQLAGMLDHKDFTLLNVKTPYVGEIAGTDLYIPYDELAARANELPANKEAKVVVYCRTGHESAIAAQTLIDLGYTTIDNLDGGMTAWTATGRQLVTLDRTGGGS